jgi:hypothetical protein
MLLQNDAGLRPESGNLQQRSSIDTTRRAHSRST